MTNDNYYMDYIADKSVFKAVMFARKLMRNGIKPGLANYKAAKYYGVNTSEVAHYVGQVGGNCSQRYSRIRKRATK